MNDPSIEAIAERWDAEGFEFTCLHGHVNFSHASDLQRCGSCGQSLTAPRLHQSLVNAAPTDIAYLLARIEAVKDLHRPFRGEDGAAAFCQSCLIQFHPCPTVRALSVPQPTPKETP